MTTPESRLVAARLTFVRLSAADARRIDELCDFFEYQLQVRGGPRIENLLGSLQDPLRAILFRELLLLETEALLVREGLPDRAKYRHRFPAYASIVDEVFDSRFPEEESQPIESLLPSGQPWPEIPNYRILREVSRGGMGRVFEAIHTRLGSRVALKLMHPDLARDVGAEVRFEREMKVIGTLVHPNIVQARDAGKADNVHYLAMELIDGCDLAELLERVGPLTVPDACEIVRRAALALQYAHQRNLVHRDIKPKNVLLGRSSTTTAEAEVKVVDFGLALLRGFSTLRNSIGPSVVVGTFTFMAPEQFWEQQSDIRSDVYSLGCTLYCLLTGRPPFGMPDYANSLDIMTAHRDVTLPSLQTRRPDVGEGLEAIVNRMTAKDPGRRYSTPTQVATALEVFAKGHRLTELLAEADSRRSLPDPVPRRLTAEPPVIKQVGKNFASNSPSDADVDKTTPFASTPLASSDDGRTPLPLPPEEDRIPRAIRRRLAAVLGLILVGYVVVAYLWRTTAVDLVALVGDPLPGGWHRDGNVLVSPDAPAARIGFPLTLPTEYKLEIEAERVTGGKITVGVVWQDRVVPIPLETGRLVTESVGGSSSAALAPTVLKEFDFTGGAPRTFTCIVRASGCLMAYEDRVKSIRTAHELAVAADTAGTKYAPYLETHNSVYRIHRLILTPLDR